LRTVDIGIGFAGLPVVLDELWVLVVLPGIFFDFKTSSSSGEDVSFRKGTNIPAGRDEWP